MGESVKLVSLVPEGCHWSLIMPLALKNTTKRFGIVAACATRGRMASKNGSASAMPPAPRSTARRGMGFDGMLKTGLRVIYIPPAR